MSTTSSITATTSTDAYGNTYTTSVADDGLDSEDFLTLMLTELSMQDPTDPVDSSSMLDTQLQLSTLEANIAMTETMESLQSSFEQTALSNSATLIGNIIENGNTDDEGNLVQYMVSSVQGADGEITLTAYEVTGYYDVYYVEETSSEDDLLDSSSSSDTISITNSDDETYEFETYNKTYEELASEISEIDGITATLAENSSGNYQLVISVANGSSSISQNGISLSYTEDNATSYNSEAEEISFTTVTGIY